MRLEIKGDLERFPRVFGFKHFLGCIMASPLFGFLLLFDLARGYTSLTCEITVGRKKMIHYEFKSATKEDNLETL